MIGVMQGLGTSSLCNQWRDEQLSEVGIQQLVRYYDRHHSAFKKYVAGNKPSFYKAAIPLLSYAGLLR